MMDISTLSPNEKDALIQQLLGGSTGHSDEAADKAMLQPLVDAVEMIVDKVTEMDEQLNKLSKLVIDDLIGGIKTLHSEGLRDEGIEGLKSRYAEMFGDYGNSYKDVYDGELYDELYDALEEMKGNEGFDEKAEVEKVFNLLKSKIDKVRGISAEPAAAVETVVAKSPEDDVVRKVKALKKAGL